MFENKIQSVGQEEMGRELAKDASRAFLEDIGSSSTINRLQVQTDWWKALDSDQPAPAILNRSNIPSLEANGWDTVAGSTYDSIKRTLKDGSLEENDYDNLTGNLFNKTITRYQGSASTDNKMAAQRISANYKNGEMTNLSIVSGNFDNEFRASFDHGKLLSAFESGKSSDFKDYKFREDGSLSEMVDRRRADSYVLKDQLFDSLSQPRCDNNPLYIISPVERWVTNFINGLEELKRSRAF